MERPRTPYEAATTYISDHPEIQASLELAVNSAIMRKAKTPLIDIADVLYSQAAKHGETAVQSESATKTEAKHGETAVQSESATKTEAKRSETAVRSESATKTEESVDDADAVAAHAAATAILEGESPVAQDSVSTAQSKVEFTPDAPPAEPGRRGRSRRPSKEHMLSVESLNAGTDEWGVRIRIFTASLTCERACRVGLMNFTYTGDTIASADADDTTVETVTDAEGLSGRLASGRSRHGHGEIRYDSGAHYVGAWVRGKRAGKGRMVFPHGDTYDGEWLGGQYHGFGRYSSQTADEYEGEWSHDKMCGNGRYLYRDSGDVYEGGWADGFREGFGKLTKANGDVFVGQYEAGELIKKTQLDKHSLEMGVDADGKRIKFITATASGQLSLAAGLGQFTYTGDTIASADADDTTVETVTNAEGVSGHLASGRSRHGHGEIRYDSGAHYVGAWVRGKRSGEGKFNFACGDSYEGGWLDGMFHGHGKYASTGSDEYEGEWRADKMEGHGKLTRRDTGEVWEGNFVDGKKHGVGTCTSPSGVVETREYMAGEQVEGGST